MKIVTNSSLSTIRPRFDVANLIGRYRSRGIDDRQIAEVLRQPVRRAARRRPPGLLHLVAVLLVLRRAGLALAPGLRRLDLVSDVVCVTSTWVSHLVCDAWTWVVDKVQAAVSTIAWAGCKLGDLVTRVFEGRAVPDPVVPDDPLTAQDVFVDQQAPGRAAKRWRRPDAGVARYD